MAVETVLAFYAARAGEEGWPRAKSGAVTAVQRTSSDLRLNPHIHVIALDGAWREQDGELAWEGLGHLGTSEVGEVLEHLVRRLERYLRRSGQLQTFEDEGEADVEDDPEGTLAASAVVWPGAAGRAAVGEPPRPPRAAGSGLRQAAVRVARWVHVARGDAGGRSRPGGAGGAAALRDASSGCAGARGAASRRPRAHHVEEGLHRRDDRSRHGPAVSAVPAGHQRAPPRLHTLRYAGVLAPASP